MTLLHEAVDTKKLDVRTIERNLARGVVSAAEVDQSIKQLPDDAENAEYVSIQSLADSGSDDSSDDPSDSDDDRATHH